MIYVIVFIIVSFLTSLFLGKVIRKADKADEAYFNGTKTNRGELC